MIGSFLDAWFYRKCPDSPPFLNTPWGRVRYRCSGNPALPGLLMVPDGPCVIEHFDSLVERLSDRWRVAVADLPGFGFSKPNAHYAHTPAQVCEVLLALLDQLAMPRALLNFTCVNGYYALSLARRQPHRVLGVILGQTPAIEDMHRWVDRVIPRPLRWPVLGQGLNYAQRRKIAQRWYQYALPKGTDLESWRFPSMENLQMGGCNCLATLVQGMQKCSDSECMGVTVPVVAMWGAADRTHKPTPRDSILKLVPHAKLQILEGVGHFPNLERPELLERNLQSFQ